MSLDTIPAVLSSVLSILTAKLILNYYNVASTFLAFLSSVLSILNY